MPIINIYNNSRGISANKGSSENLLRYLLDDPTLTDDNLQLFNDIYHRIPVEAAISIIDNNTKGLKKDEAHFYHIDVNLSFGEVETLTNRCLSKLDMELALINFARLHFIPIYATNFKGYKTSKGEDIVFLPDDIVWVAIIKDVRKKKKNINKNNPGWNIHFVISRRNKSLTRNLSPTRNNANCNNGCCQGSFNRNQFRLNIEKAYDDYFRYNRPLSDSIAFRTMGKISIEELEKKVNTALEKSEQLQLKIEAKR